MRTLLPLLAASLLSACANGGSAGGEQAPAGFETDYAAAEQAATAQHKLLFVFFTAPW